MVAPFHLANPAGSLPRIKDFDDLERLGAPFFIKTILPSGLGPSLARVQWCYRASKRTWPGHFGIQSASDP